VHQLDSPGSAVHAIRDALDDHDLDDDDLDDDDLDNALDDDTHADDVGLGSSEGFAARHGVALVPFSRAPRVDAPPAALRPDLARCVRCVSMI